MKARHVVEINEAIIFTYGGHRRGAPGWWARESAKPGIEKRTTVLIHSIPGRLLYLDCEDREEAEFVRDYVVGRGINKKAVRIVRIGQLATCGRCRERRPLWARMKGVARCRPCFDQWVADGCPLPVERGAA